MSQETVGAGTALNSVPPSCDLGSTELSTATAPLYQGNFLSDGTS